MNYQVLIIKILISESFLELRFMADMRYNDFFRISMRKRVNLKFCDIECQRPSWKIINYNVKIYEYKIQC